MSVGKGDIHIFVAVTSIAIIVIIIIIISEEAYS